jgi:hypothetical protein
LVTTGTQTFAGNKTFNGVTDPVGGFGTTTNGAASATNSGLVTTGTQTFAGAKTFSSTITGSITGNAGTVTNGVYTTGDQSIAGVKTFTSPVLHPNIPYALWRNTSTTTYGNGVPMPIIGALVASRGTFTFNASTGTFTVPVTGLYHISATFRAEFISGTPVVEMGGYSGFQVNGTATYTTSFRRRYTGVQGLPSDILQTVEDNFSITYPLTAGQEIRAVMAFVRNNGDQLYKLGESNPSYAGFDNWASIVFLG